MRTSTNSSIVCCSFLISSPKPGVSIIVTFGPEKDINNCSFDYNRGIGKDITFLKCATTLLSSKLANLFRVKKSGF